ACAPLRPAAASDRASARIDARHAAAPALRGDAGTHGRRRTLAPALHALLSAAEANATACGRGQSRCAAPDRMLPGTGGQEARARPGCGRACARRRAVARARRDADELRARASRLAVALQVPAGRAERSAL